MVLKKHLILIIFIISKGLVLGNYADSLYKIKKLNFGIETGVGININSNYFAEDQNSIMTSNNKTKLNLNIIYDITSKVRIIGFIEHSKHSIQQSFLYDSEPQINLKHKLNAINFKFVLFTKILRDNKSNFYLGMGFGSCRYLNNKTFSKVKNIQVNGENKSLVLVAEPFQKNFACFNISMLYEYQLKLFDVGLKYDFTAARSVFNSYSILLDNEKTHEGHYLPNGMNCELSLFLKFKRKRK